MSTGNQITANELTHPTNRRKFLSYLGAAPTLTAFAGAGLFSSTSALADTGPLNSSQRRHRAFVVRRDAAIYQRDQPEQTSTDFERRRATLRKSHRELQQGPAAQRSGRGGPECVTTRISQH